MTWIEIAIIVIVGIFAIISILRLFGIKLEKVLFAEIKKKEKKKKEKKSRAPKEKNRQVVKEEKKQEQPKSQQESDEKGFVISKKGVARISKKAKEGRDSRTLEPKIEQAIVKGQGNSGGYESFDDMLRQMKSVGDPDDLDDETFRRMFMSPNFQSDDEPEGFNYGEADDELSSDFVSLESPESGKIDRKLKHFTIDGTHLRIGQTFDNAPNRSPTFQSKIEFTERITGRYANITMGDVSNRLAPAQIEETKNQKQEDVLEDSDEDIFAKIMERRRRELGLEPAKREEEMGNSTKEIVISPETLVIADAIMNPRFKAKPKF